MCVFVCVYYSILSVHVYIYCRLPSDAIRTGSSSSRTRSSRPCALRTRLLRHRHTLQHVHRSRHYNMCKHVYVCIYIYIAPGSRGLMPFFFLFGHVPESQPHRTAARGRGVSTSKIGTAGKGSGAKVPRERAAVPFFFSLFGRVPGSQSHRTVARGRGGLVFLLFLFGRVPGSQPHRTTARGRGVLVCFCSVWARSWISATSYSHSRSWCSSVCFFFSVWARSWISTTLYSRSRSWCSSVCFFLFGRVPGSQLHRTVRRVWFSTTSHSRSSSLSGLCARVLITKL